jgi:hypothetical protein
MNVTGISWILSATHGTARLRRCGSHADLRELYGALRSDGTIATPFQNFGRFDENSRLVCLGVALALQDAGISSVNAEKRDAGLLVSSTDGATNSNLVYFRDYVKGGRKLGRGNLFIYTLPTSPAAEAAIHFGLTGPLLYLGQSTVAPDAALLDSVAMIRDGLTDAMLCVLLKDAAVICAVVESKPLPGQLSMTIEKAVCLIDQRLRGRAEDGWAFGPASEERAKARP